MSFRRECNNCGQIGFFVTDDNNAECEECGRTLKIEDFGGDFNVTEQVIEEGDPEMEVKA